ncbi:MAG: metallophosphoesterase family protein [Halobacteriota archaeon]
MAAILHTADVHLRRDEPERMAALRAVVELAESLDVDALTIGGDLFDRPRDVEALRSELRNDLFTDRGFEIVLIPGNHDLEAFRDDTFFGDACRVLLGEPFETVELAEGAIRLVGLPYTERPTDDLMVALTERDPFDGIEVLLFHCTLDIGFRGDDLGDETTVRYFPVTPDELEALGFDYYLAGHHHNPRQVDLESGTFVYPGTPASTRSTETGRRQAVSLDPKGGIGFHPLATHHLERETFPVLPGEEEAVLDRIETWVAANVNPDTEATVVVEGFHGLDEASFHERLQGVTDGADLVDDTVTATRIQANPVYERFEEHLADRDWPEEMTKAVRRRVMEAFVAQGGVS